MSQKKQDLQNRVKLERFLLYNKITGTPIALAGVEKFVETKGGKTKRTFGADVRLIPKVISVNAIVSLQKTVDGVVPKNINWGIGDTELLPSIFSEYEDIPFVKAISHANSDGAACGLIKSALIEYGSFFTVDENGFCGGADNEEGIEALFDRYLASFSLREEDKLGAVKETVTGRGKNETIVRVNLVESGGEWIYVE